MKFNINLSVMFVLMINTAFGAVGDVGVSDTSATLSQASVNQPSLSSYGISSYDSYPAQGQDNSQSQQSAYPAPQIGGPMQEQLTAEQLGLSQPQMESFAPDGRLGFVSASQPVDAALMVSGTAQSSVPSSTSSYVQSALPGSSIWYYPSSLGSAN